MRIVATIAVLLLGGTPAVAQVPACEHSVVVSVIAKQGPVGALPREFFEVKVGGDSAEVTSVEPAPLRRIVLLADLSGSMREKRPVVDHALSIILGSAPQRVEMALVGFADEVHVLAPPGRSREQVWQSWLDLPDFDAMPRQKKKNGEPPEPRFGEGRTALRDALLVGLDMLGGGTPADVLLLIGDGGDNRSSPKEKLLFQRLRESHVRVAALLMLEPNPVTPEEARAATLMRSFADAGGGLVVQLPLELTRINVRAAADQLLGSLSSAHRLTLKLAEPVEKPKRLRVRISKEAQLKEALAYYPDRLNPCTTPGAQRHAN
jgi:hypothetical protein